VKNVKFVTVKPGGAETKYWGLKRLKKYKRLLIQDARRTKNDIIEASVHVCVCV
jgi:hypothetical protein